MKIYRLLALLLVLIMLVGCNAQTEDTEGTKNTIPTTGTSQTTTPPADEGDDNGNSQINGGNQNGGQGNNQDNNENNNENNNNEGNTTPQEPSDDDQKEDTTLKILTIGNSFSDDTMQYMYQIAEAAGGYTEIKLGNLFIGGCSLAKHATNAREDKAAYDYRRNSSGSWNTTADFKMSNAIKEEDWDIISLQQASGSSGIADTYSDLTYLINYVKALAPKAKLVWNMTWAYQKDSTHKDFAKYDGSQKIMYESIISAVIDKVDTNKNISVIVPNGTAIQNARTSYVGDKLTRDGFHLTLDMGRYTAGLTFFHAVTGKSIENLSYMPAGVDKNLQKVAIESAMNAVKEPWEVTESKYDTLPGIDLTEYEKLDMQWTALGYWHSNNTSGPYNTIIQGGSNTSKQFYASARFTKAELPVGSIIVLANGWQYRPEGWTDEGRLTSTRPGNKTDAMITVTDAWWGDYIYRAFNLAKIDKSSLENISAQEIEAAFTVYVPKNN